jgi:tRNA U34 5-methylaminomethyl-2-thiouridine-forming methyltransferase MnmC
MSYNSYSKYASSNPIEQIVTDDGTPTLMLTGLNETYHSRHGANSESEHVYIGMGLLQLSDLLFTGDFPEKEKISIFEMGFGTGLNAFLTSKVPVSDHRGKEYKVEYTGVDSAPLNLDIQTEYMKALDLSNEDRSHFNTIAEEQWIPMDDLEEGGYKRLNPRFGFRKIESDIRDYLGDRYERKLASYDLVFWDAFGPKKQSELWDKWIFKRMYDMMSDCSMLVTYSAATAVQKGLLEAGFQLEKIPGPPNKREMLRAYKFKGDSK